MKPNEVPIIVRVQGDENGTRLDPSRRWSDPNQNITKTRVGQAGNLFTGANGMFRVRICCCYRTGKLNFRLVRIKWSNERWKIAEKSQSGRQI